MRSLRAIAGAIRRRLRPAPDVGEALAHVEAVVGGTLAASALHLESGRTYSRHGTRAVPMASLVKIPLAVHVLSRIDADALRADAMVDVEPRHLRPDSWAIGRAVAAPGVSLSIANLLRLAMIESDNAATDLLLDLTGGPAALQAALHARGAAAVRVDRTMLELVSDACGVGREHCGPALEPARWRAARATIAPGDVAAAGAAFLADPRDTAPPDAIAALLAAAWRGDGLSEASRDALRDMMAACRTGHTRLRAGVPAGVLLGHKSGSMRRHLTSDAGVLRLPDGAGQLALVVAISGSPAPVSRQERAIADAARAIHRHFVAAAGARAPRAAGAT